MPEPCPFCGKPIVREYGSFRCKHCAGSSEDLIDRERKARAAEIRKQTRGGKSAAAVEPVLSAPKLKPETRAEPEPGAEPEPRTEPKARAEPKPRAKAVSATKKPAAATAKKPVAAATSAPGATKSARLRMVATAHARIAERKKSNGDEPPSPAKKSLRKDR